MAKTEHERKEAKRLAVLARLTEAQASLTILSGMWDERTLDLLILILGIGRVEIND